LTEALANLQSAQFDQKNEEKRTAKATEKTAEATIRSASLLERLAGGTTILHQPVVFGS
jgi:hypothetical protein